MAKLNKYVFVKRITDQSQALFASITQKEDYDNFTLVNEINKSIRG